MLPKGPVRPLAVLLALLASAALARAQTAAALRGVPGRPAREAGFDLDQFRPTEGGFGLGTQWTRISGTAFRPTSSADQWSGSSTVTPSTASGATFVAPVDIPNGAVLQEIRLLVTDIDPGPDIAAKLFLASQAIGGSTTCGGYFLQGTSSGLVGTGVLTLTGPLTLRTRGTCNAVDSYYQWFVAVGLASQFQSLSGAILVWNRQVSPPPVAATFNDVPSSDPFFTVIEALAASGITSGCGAGNFCPNDVVTRNQMAKFLARGLGLNWPQ